MKKNFVTVLFAALVFITPLSVFAKTGFVSDGRKTLEEKVRAKHDVQDVLARVSQLRSFDSWGKEVDPDYRLYIVSRWVEQRSFKEAYRLLATIPDEKVNADLVKFYYATLLLELGDVPGAGKVIADLGEKYPQDPDFLFLKSTELALNQDYINAANVLTAVIESAPQDGKAHLQRGIIYLYALSHEMALKDFYKAIRLLPRNEVYFRQMAYLQAGILELQFKLNPKKGHRLIKQGAKLDPNSSLIKELNLRDDLY